MRNKKAKALRKMVYKETPSSHRVYRQLSGGQIVADERRQKYQKAKGR